MTLQPRTTQLETYPSSIKCLKRCHPNAGVLTIIIRELYQRQMVIPTTSEVNHTRSQYVLQCLNGVLCLPLSLRRKGSTKLYMHAYFLLGGSAKM